MALNRLHLDACYLDADAPGRGADRLRVDTFGDQISFDLSAADHRATITTCQCLGITKMIERSMTNHYEVDMIETVKSNGASGILAHERIEQNALPKPVDDLISRYAEKADAGFVGERHGNFHGWA